VRLAKPEGSDEVEHSYRGAAGSCTVPAATEEGSPSWSWTALKDRAAASMFKARSPHRSSCRRRARKERRPSTEIRLGVHLQLIAHEPWPAFLHQPAIVGERDPPPEGWME
jgi:hypothetical protein